MQDRASDEATNDGETNEMLIAVAKEHGYTISKRQLAEWHRIGLLPEPHQIYREQPGSTSVYPRGTSERLLVLCSCRKRNPHNLGDVAWGMWWQGLEVPEHYIRSLLCQVTAKWGEQRGKLRTERSSRNSKTAPTFKLSRLAQTAIDKAQNARSAISLVRQARKRTGSFNFPTMVRVLLEVAIGAFPGFDTGVNTKTADEDRAIVEAGLGLQRARTDRLSGRPWLNGDTGETLHLLSSTLEQYPIGYDLDNIDIGELARTRDEVWTYVTFMQSYSAFLERAFGRGAFGMTVFGWIIRRLKPADQGFILLFWRSARAAGLGAHLDQILEVARHWIGELMPLLWGLEELRAQFPETQELLSDQQMGRAVRRKRVMEQTLKALRLLREERTADIDAFFAQRPDIWQAMTKSEASKPLPDASDQE
jgi:hypothetical protein